MTSSNIHDCLLSLLVLLHLTDVLPDAAAGITEEGEDSQAGMDNAFKWIMRWGLGLACLLFIIWPLLALPAKDFSKGYFTFWCEVMTNSGSILPLIKFPDNIAGKAIAVLF